MALVRPLAPDASGIAKQIVAPDTIDPAILPSSGSSVPVVVANGITFAVATNTQVFARRMTVYASGEITVAATAELVFA